MKSSESMIDELEKTLMTDVNRLILYIVGMRFREQISKIAKISITDIIQYHLNETIWLDQIKNNIKAWILEYQMEMAEQSKQLNLRMDFLEQRQLDFMRKIEIEYSKKSVFDNIAGEI